MEGMSEHTCLISSYQLLIAAACTNTGGKMKSSHSRAADWCPFVPRHSVSQVTSYMQLGMLWANIDQDLCRHMASLGHNELNVVFYCCGRIRNFVHWHWGCHTQWPHLTHWGRVTQIYVSKLAIICSDNGVSLGRHQAMILTNPGILLIRTLQEQTSVKY